MIESERTCGRERELEKGGESERVWKKEKTKLRRVIERLYKMVRRKYRHKIREECREYLVLYLKCRMKNLTMSRIV